jgi:mono/diheme cytochrome c family protein
MFFMKKALKVLVIILVVLVVGLGALIGFVTNALPNVGPATDMKITYSPENIARGKYLAYHVTACMDCHSTRDWSRFSGPLVPGTLGKGGELFDQKFGFPGVYYSRNITPFGIKRYTDGELFRVITTGVTREGRAMFPVMPYTYYAHMDPEDVKCIIAFIRSLEPLNNEVPASVSDFPMNIIIHLIPKKAEPVTRPDPSNETAYGAYLVNACACRECHTPDKNGQIIPELAFSGGRAFKLPAGGTVRSANLTSSTTTGIGSWTREMFVRRFRSYTDSGYVAPTVAKGQFNSMMPWTMYGGMTETDLGAIYAYLHSLPAKENAVVKFSAE